jgi:gamma-polyglutamate biosynthesis protein CapA
MTALVATELGEAEDTAIVSKKALATYGKNGNLSAGEKIAVSELFYPLLLESSNDAAEVLAEFFGRDFFIDKMNQQAEILELENTSFEDPSGLSTNNRSTALDLFKLTGFIKKEKPDLLEITTARSRSNVFHNWSSNNQFLHEDGYLGGKSGYTEPAGQSVISVFSVPLAETSTRNVAIALLKSEDRFRDVSSILKFLKSNVYYGGEADASADWVKQREGVPELRSPDYVTLAFLGDIMLDRGVQSSVRKNFGGDYSALFEKMGDLKKSDIVFANLEGTASDVGEDAGNLYSFRMDPSVVPALRGGGINILSVANNHVGDFGREAFIDTLSRLRENEIFYIGGGENSEEAEQPVVFERYGIKIGYLGFSDVGPEWMLASETKAGILSAQNPRLKEIIQRASAQVDYLMVSFHWGDEYQALHNGRQEALAHKAIDSGAKIVVGHHPHVIEDTEVYKNGFIAYSLGNFIFDQGFSADTMQGMWLEIKLRRNGNMSVRKNTVKLNRLFQPDSIVAGKEEKIEFDSEL